MYQKLRKNTRVNLLTRYLSLCTTLHSSQKENGMKSAKRMVSNKGGGPAMKLVCGRLTGCVLLLLPHTAVPAPA